MNIFFYTKVVVLTKSMSFLFNLIVVSNPRAPNITRTAPAPISSFRPVKFFFPINRMKFKLSSSMYTAITPKEMPNNCKNTTLLGQEIMVTVFMRYKDKIGSKNYS